MGVAKSTPEIGCLQNLAQKLWEQGPAPVGGQCIFSVIGAVEIKSEKSCEDGGWVVVWGRGMVVLEGCAPTYEINLSIEMQKQMAANDPSIINDKPPPL